MRPLLKTAFGIGALTIYRTSGIFLTFVNVKTLFSDKFKTVVTDTFETSWFVATSKVFVTVFMILSAFVQVYTSSVEFDESVPTSQLSFRRLINFEHYQGGSFFLSNIFGSGRSLRVRAYKQPNQADQNQRTKSVQAVSFSKVASLSSDDYKLTLQSFQIFILLKVTNMISSSSFSFLRL